MVIRDKMSLLRTYNLMNANQMQLTKSLTRIVTGMKINSAQDNPSAYSISESLRTRIRSLEQAELNTEHGFNMIKTAEDAAANILDILKTLKTKALDAANDSNTDENRRVMQKEFKSLVEQIDSGARTTFNGIALVDDSATVLVLINSGDRNFSFQIGADAEDKIEITLGDVRAKALGLSDELNISTKKDADAAIKIIDDAINKVAERQTTIGAFLSSLGYISDNLETQGENLQLSDSAYREADIASEIVDFVNLSLYIAAVTKKFTHINQKFLFNDEKF